MKEITPEVIKTYQINDSYYVDVTFDRERELYGGWLYHKDYMIKEMIIHVFVKDKDHPDRKPVTRDRFLDIVTQELDYDFYIPRYELKYVSGTSGIRAWMYDFMQYLCGEHAPELKKILLRTVASEADFDFMDKYTAFNHYLAEHQMMGNDISLERMAAFCQRRIEDITDIFALSDAVKKSDFYEKETEALKKAGKKALEDK